MDVASLLASAPPVARTRKGPPPACEIYGRADIAIYETIHARRERGESWGEVQKLLDGILHIDRPIHNDKFRYHWSAKCAHWDGVEIP